MRRWRCEKCGEDLGLWEKPDETHRHLVLVENRHVPCGPVSEVKTPDPAPRTQEGRLQ